MPSEENSEPELPVGEAPEGGTRPLEEEEGGGREGIRFSGRLHPATFVFVVWRTVKGFLIPALLLLFFSTNPFFAYVLLVFMAGALVQGVLRYFTFRYRVENGELVTRQGLLERRERHIPLSRVQDLRVEQGILHRLLRTVDLHVETAGGSGPEATLSVLSRSEAEKLRQAVFSHLAAEQGVAAPCAAGDGEERVLKQLRVVDLAKAGLTSNQAASSLVVLFALWRGIEAYLPKLYERLEKVVSSRIETYVDQLTGSLPWLQFALGTAVLLVVGFGISVLGAIFLFYNFKLSLRGEDLYRTYGLMTRRSSSLPRRRVQVLLVQEGVLRRLAGLATLRADTAGGHPGEGDRSGEGRDVLLPAVKRAEVDGLLPAVFPDLEGSLDDEHWERVSRVAIRRGTVIGSVPLCLLVAAGAGLREEMWWWGLLLLLPVIYVINVMNYRHLGFRFGSCFLWTRRGWLSRATHIVPVRNAQSVVVRQSPFDRRHGVSSVLVDTAGQAYTGGGPQIGNVPTERALEMARELSAAAARTRFRFR